MREIKFRFYNQDTKRFYSFINGLYFDDDGKVGAYVFDWNKAEQYTGLKDKKGVEIYAGDIIRYTDDSCMSYRVRRAIAVIVSYSYKVVARVKPFDKKTYSNQNMLTNKTNEFFEIIGNIHENQELLEEEK